MGSLILLTLVLLFALNYVGVRFDKTFDFTEEKLNSLSEQSVQVIKSLDVDLNVYIFYKGEPAKAQQTLLKQNLTLFEEASPRIKLRSVDTYVDNALAMKFLNDLNDKNQGESFLFVEYKGVKKRVELSGPGQLTEEAVTSAIIRATRRGTKTIYLLTGHGERSAKLEGTDSISFLVEALEQASFQVKELNFLETPKIPDDADLIAVLGPIHPLLEGELDLLRGYFRDGGRLLIAADPGQKHNIALLTKSLGVEFKNTYIFNQLGEKIARSMAVAIGYDYDQSSPITNKFRKGEASLFNLASEVVPAPGVSNFQFTPLVATQEMAFSTADITNVQNPRPEDLRIHTLAVLAQAQAEVDPENKDGVQKRASAAVVVGDSDFLANGVFANPLNRDFALNCFSYLAEETDLLSIRPKVPNTTPIILTDWTYLGLLSGGMLLPLIFLITAGVLWYRRRGA